MNVMVIVKNLILFQNVKENYFISILDSTSPLPKKSIEISIKFKFNEWVYGWYIKEDILAKNIDYTIAYLAKISFHVDILYVEINLNL